MKKYILKMLIILFIIISPAPFDVLAADDFYYYDDFSSFNEGSVPGGLWTFNNVGGEHNIAIKDEKNMLKLSMPKSSQGIVEAIFTLPQAVYNEVVVLKTRVYLSQKNRFFSSAYVFGENSNITISSAFHKDGMFKTYSNGAWQNIAEYNSGYYDIEYVMDYESKRFDISVNGTDGNFRFRNTGTLSNNIKSVKFYIEQENCEVFIDYIKVYTQKVKEIGIIKGAEGMKINCCSSTAPQNFDKMYIDFYKSMNENSLNKDTVYIKRKSDGFKPDYSFTYDDASKRYLMEMAEPLTDGEIYEIVVKGGENGVMDSDFGKISGCDYVLRFTPLPYPISVSNAKINAADTHFFISAEVENLSGIKQTSKAITAIYKGDMLMDIEINEISACPFGNIIYESGIFNIKENGCTIKLFIWEGMSPHTETVNLIWEE